MIPSLRRASFAIALLLSISDSRFSDAQAQGSLTPPGAPAPTMKSLDQIEPRTIVNASNTPGDSNFSFIISHPGSYYFTNNLTSAGLNGVHITTNNVNLDLNGFILQGASGTTGIQIDGTNVSIANGTMAGWTADDIVCLGASLFVEHLQLSGGFYGVELYHDGRVRNCQLTDNRQAGVYIHEIGSVMECYFARNQDFGVQINGNGSTIANNDFFNNPVGIILPASNARIENNRIIVAGAAGYGIWITDTDYTNNIIVRNSVTGGGSRNYVLNASSIAGPLITNSVSGFITNSNPWANFSF